MMSEPQAGNHNDTYEIRSLFEQMSSLLEEAGILLRRVFMNADACLDVEEFRSLCADKEVEANIAGNPRSRKGLSEAYIYFDEELYRGHFVIERTNA